MLCYTENKNRHKKGEQEDGKSATVHNGNNPVGAKNAA